MSTDDVDPNKSHYNYVFCFAMIMFLNLTNWCEEIKVEEFRQRGKEFLMEHLSQDNTEASTNAGEDEEEIITETEEESYQDRVENFGLQANYIDQLVYLRNKLKTMERCSYLIK